MAESYANGPKHEVEFVKATRMLTPQGDFCVQVEIGNLARQLTPETAAKLAAAIQGELDLIAAARNKVIKYEV